LQKSERYVDYDLNRIWFPLGNNGKSHRAANAIEKEERNGLLKEFDDIIKSNSGPYYIFDLHTTSSYSVPFLVLGDTLRNREIVHDIPAPVILGLEEEAEGTMFSFLDQTGVNAVLFEAGQHDSLAAIENHISFIWLVLSKIGCIKSTDIDDFHLYFESLKKESVGKQKYYETIYKYGVTEEEGFQMDEGYVSFQQVDQDTKLARNSNGVITTPVNGLIFMPLYQKKGEDGFFVIRKINKFWLRVSIWLRKLNFDRSFGLLPGVKKVKSTDDSFIVNKRVALIFPLQIFHLFGYRRVTESEKEFIVTRRRYDSKGPEREEVIENFNQLLESLT
jgi:succinylglutamate desuccinylase